MKAKPWYQSKTIWFNLGSALLAAAELQLGVVKAFVPPDLYAWSAFGLALANVALRFISSAAIGSAVSAASKPEGSP